MLIDSSVEAAVSDSEVDESASGGQRRWLRVLRSPKAAFGLAIVLIFALLAIFGPMLVHTAPGAISHDKLKSPSWDHWLGTTQQGQDVFSQVVYGARISMEVGFGAALLATIWAIVVGLTGGYLSGTTSELLSLFSNVFLVIPSLPLVIILAAYLPDTGSLGIILVITVTGWAWGARVLRAQTLSLRRREFVEAARATGEGSFKIIFFDILPNEMAIITATFLGTVTGAILTEASIAFLGLGSVSEWSWGTILYWAQTSSAVLVGAWWWFVPPGLCIALVGTGLAFINFGLDDFINPRLRAAGIGTRKRLKLRARLMGGALARAHRAARATASVDTSPVTGDAPILDVRDLRIEYHTGASPVRAVNEVSFTLNRGEVLGIAGESGSGKSTLARAVTRLLKPPAEIVAGHMIYTTRDNQRVDLMSMSDRELREFRWEEISIVFQSAMNSLNPVLRLGAQIDDVLKAHRPNMKRPARARRIAELLALVGISPDRASAYPHELSGGMRQRAMIAMGLALDPEIIVMDEPTTALDVVIQRQIIETIMRLKDELGFSVIFITHDLSLLIELCDTIAVMYAGRLVEVSSSREFYEDPKHPYSQGLLGSFPTLTGEIKELVSVPGFPPDMRRLPSGCSFRARCPAAFESCAQHRPELLTIERPSQTRDRSAACLLFDPRIENPAEQEVDHG